MILSILNVLSIYVNDRNIVEKMYIEDTLMRKFLDFGLLLMFFLLQYILSVDRRKLNESLLTGMCLNVCW